MKTAFFLAALLLCAWGCDSSAPDPVGNEEVLVTVHSTDSVGTYYIYDQDGTTRTYHFKGTTAELLVLSPEQGPVGAAIRSEGGNASITIRSGTESYTRSTAGTGSIEAVFLWVPLGEKTKLRYRITAPAATITDPATLVYQMGREMWKSYPEVETDGGALIVDSLEVPQQFTAGLRVEASTTLPVTGCVTLGIDRLLGSKYVPVSQRTECGFSTSYEHRRTLSEGIGLYMR